MNPSTMTAAIAVKTLKQAALDYNYWGESESDSPLEIKRSKSVLDDKRILSLDGSMRRKQHPELTALPASRTIRIETLSEVFSPLVGNAASDLEMKIAAFKTGEQPIESLEMSTEALEFYTQLYTAFNALTETKVYYVDAPNDAYVGMFITGKSSDGEAVYGQSLLVPT